MDKILFSERLTKLRKARGYKTQSALATEYNIRFPSTRKGKKDENTSGILGTIKNYENANHSGSPNLEIVLNLCEILECDLDYLIGKIECKEHDTQFIHDQTGLSENTIQHLISLNSSDEGFICIPIIDYLIGNTDFSTFLMKKINDYYCKYEMLREADSIYAKENKEIRKKIGNIPVILQNNVSPSELQHSVTRQDLMQYIDIAESKRFQIQKEFDNILIELVKYHYNINHPVENK